MRPQIESCYNIKQAVERESDEQEWRRGTSLRGLGSRPGSVGVWKSPKKDSTSDGVETKEFVVRNCAA